MKTKYDRPFRSSLPSYHENAVLQLIIASSACFISYHLARVVLLVAEANPTIFPNYFTVNLALPEVHNLPKKLWTILTYGWIHNGFWELFSNMIWLYCFGSIVQMLVGYKQVIPLFVYSLLLGGVFYEVAQLIPGEAFKVNLLWFGAQAGLMGLAVAALTLAPGYRIYLGERLSIPIVIIACIFFGLMVINSNLKVPALFLLVGGAAMGFAYVRLLQSGYKPGEWAYNISDWVGKLGTPDKNAAQKHRYKRNQVLSTMYEPKQGITQKRIDDILDKINQKGYNSLSKEEKEILMKAGKEEDNN